MTLYYNSDLLDSNPTSDGRGGLVRCPKNDDVTPLLGDGPESNPPNAIWSIPRRWQERADIRLTVKHACWGDLE